MKNFLTFLMLLLFSSLTFSQQVQPIDSISFENQFDNLIKNATKYEDFRVVKTSEILLLKANVTKSFSKLNSEITAKKYELNTQKIKNDSLIGELKTTEETISTLKSNMNNVSFLGIQINNTVFHTLLVVLFLTLIVLLILFIYKFNQSNKITLETTQNFKELEESFNVHRKNALEREQKISRQLIDEINKHKKE
jgi:hypothetical protein